MDQYPEALLQTRLQCFNSTTGDRPGVDNLVIIVTDGVPFPIERLEPAIHEAATLRDTGVTIIAIGVTDEIDEDFLKEMSSFPQIKTKITLWLETSVLCPKLRQMW